MSRSTRRAFLLSLLGLTALAGGGTALWNVRGSTEEPALFVARLIRRRLPYLEIDPEDLARFAAEHLARADAGEREQLHRLARSQSRLLQKLLPFLRSSSGALSFEDRQLERTIVARFLLATDFFRHDEEPRAVRYVAYPDPYEIGCANPLAVRG